MTIEPQPAHPLAALSRDGRIIFITRILRLFAYGMVSMVLMLFLTSLAFSAWRAGLVLTLALLGDMVISLWVTTRADRIGRRNMLLLSAVRLLFAGAVFALTSSFILLIVAAVIGVISPSGKDVGPFLAIEQAALAHLLPERLRTGVFAWYNLVGSVAVAFGALAAGLAIHGFVAAGFSLTSGYRFIFLFYAMIGVLLAALFYTTSAAMEVEVSAQAPPSRLWPGLHRSRGVVLKLSALFSLDAFGGGFVIESLLAYWLHVRFGADITQLGAIFFAANILAGISALLAARLARRFGLINTMVFTHIPSNILLMLVPLMPNLRLAALVLLARFSISQMDVPTRQAYTMAVVDPDERSAAAGVTGVARSTGAAVSPFIAAQLLAIPALLMGPFFIAGGVKIIYDLLLWKNFRSSVAEGKIAASA